MASIRPPATLEVHYTAYTHPDTTSPRTWHGMRLQLTPLPWDLSAAKGDTKPAFGDTKTFQPRLRAGSRLTQCPLNVSPRPTLAIFATLCDVRTAYVFAHSGFFIHMFSAR